MPAIVHTSPMGPMVISDRHVIIVESAAGCIVTIYRNAAAGWSLGAAGAPRNGDRRDLRARLADDTDALEALTQLKVL